ncbi:MAG: thiol-disulfide oxidoreductase [Cycloclasticus sp.]|nr:MAG: thiol-disulfide oxidoreductase [Cycloclasticus sp.]
MVIDNHKITVYYDKSCPSCVKDRQSFERIAGKRAEQFIWFDITNQDEALRKSDIQPIDALRNLHVKDAEGIIYSEMDAYSLIMKKIPLLAPIGLLISLPIIKPILSYFYRKSVDKRLICEGRLNK